LIESSEASDTVFSSSFGNMSV